ncbi:carbohydrate-binding domain-containing protein, partial [Bacteroidales bacterium OttesenSCG-928-M11]|nr:carbohydrate-binding domain-containing protein [Bacteroidales bacterium OttesenSCG-928-M11]
NSGTITVICSQTNEGGEGMESKATYTVNGGNIHVETKDDCINASKHIQINGGTIYCSSSGNDAIDSNGTITITGGITIANGTSAPETSFDCDNNTFSVTGGIILGTGGGFSTPTSTTNYFVNHSATPGNAICLENSDGEIILLYQLPTYSSAGDNQAGPGGGKPGGGGPGGNNGSSSMSFLFSDPVLSKGSSYTLTTGGTISGGTSVNGYNLGGTYSGGTSKTFTITGTITAVSM